MNLLKIKTTLGQAYGYGHYLLRQPDLPEKKFVIFGRGRCGSTLLVSLLNSHSKIHCDGEILHNPVLSPHFQIKLCASRCNKSVYGFKLLTYQIRQVQQIKNSHKFLQQLHDQMNFKIIYLKRRNLLQHSLSNIYARQKNKFHHRDHDGQLEQQAIPVNVDEVWHWMDMLETGEKYESEWLKGLPYLSLIYEDDLQHSSSQQTTINQICNLLDIPSAPVKTDLVKIMPLNLRDIVKNYDELAEALKTTKYAQFLESNS